MTELLRNFWTRQSRPCIAVPAVSRACGGSQEEPTGIRYFSNFVATVAIPEYEIN